MIYRGDVSLQQLVNSYNFFGTFVGGNTQKGWDVVFYLFPQDNKIVKHINCNNINVVHPNEEGNEYDHMSSTSMQLVDGMLYKPSGET